MGEISDRMKARADALETQAKQERDDAADVRVLEDGPLPAPSFTSVELSATEVEAGQSVTVLWDAQDADSVSVTKDDGAIAELGTFGGSGSFTDTPQADTTYTLTAIGAGGETVATVDVVVVQPRPAPTVDALTVSPSEVEAGQEVEVAWQTTEADTVRVEFVGSSVVDLGAQPSDGSLFHAPPESGRYRVTAANPEGTASAEASVTVTQPAGDDDVDVVIADQLVNGHTVPAGELHEIRGTVESDANVVVLGTLRMRPGSTLRFVDVDESAYRGGGMDVLSTDVGLWVMGDGVLDLQGTPRTGWTRLAPGDAPPADWQDGDEILVCPNGPGETSPEDFHVGVFPEVASNVPTPFILPDGTPLPTEVANLTRDVVIEGTPGGRAHVLIRSTQPQTIRHVRVQHMGPRHSETHGDNVLGRYPVHFHHSGDGSRGSVVEGVVVMDSGNHAFVPHESNGVAMRDCVAYRIQEDAYWWDEGDETDDTVWERCLAADVRHLGRGIRRTGFLLGRGTGNVVRACAVVGLHARSSASGYHWPEAANDPPNSWVFEDNTAHNCNRHGTFTWQNTIGSHPVNGFICYRCGGGGHAHGAYLNRYRYSRFVISDVETGLGWAAQTHHDVENAPDRPDGYAMSFEDGLVNNAQVGIRVSHHNASPKDGPTLFKDITFGPNVPVKLLATETSGDPSLADFVNCGIEPKDTEIDTVPGSRFRFQREDGTAFQLDHEGNVTEIEPFYEVDA